MGGWRLRHASVVHDHPDQDMNNHNNNNKRQTVVVLGGIDEGYYSTNSVLVLNLSELDKQWREGPPINKARCGHAAVVCNGGVYVIGGYHDNEDNDATATLGFMERIDANDMLQSFSTTRSTYESH